MKVVAIKKEIVDLAKDHLDRWEKSDEAANFFTAQAMQELGERLGWDDVVEEIAVVARAIPK